MFILNTDVKTVLDRDVQIDRYIHILIDNMYSKKRRRTIWQTDGQRKSVLDVYRQINGQIDK